MKIKFLLVFLFTLSLSTGYSLDIESSRKAALGPHKPMIIDRKAMDINTINAWFRNDGEFYSDHKTTGPGFEWPKGSKVHAIFSSSMWIGARVVNPDDTTKKDIRVATVGHFGSEFRPGIILPDGVADDFTRSKYRYYQVRPNEDSPHTNADYAEWPAQDGAPFHDVDKDGIYNPNVDKPALIWGNDIVYPDVLMFAVYNDAEEAYHSWIWGRSLPLGAEIRQTSWAYNRAGPFGQMQFMRFEVINKSSSPWDSAYLVVWSDPDLGDAFDDASGVDTTIFNPKTNEKRNLGFVYNGTNTDPVYGTAPPAVGYKYFQGPRFKTGVLTDTAKWSGNLIPGYKNLNLSGFNFYCNPTQGGCTNPDWYDPWLFLQSYNVMQGLTRSGRRWVCNGDTTYFMFAGDPVANTGCLYSSLLEPSDVRFTMPAGPFTIMPGDTQQVVIGVIVARGSNNLNSIKVLRTYADMSQTLFNNNFKLPPAPPSPQVEHSYVDGKIILSWDKDKKSQNFINYDEKFFNTTWKFNSFTIYQTNDPLLRPNARTEKLGTYYVKGDSSELKDFVTFPGVSDPVLAIIWEGDFEGIIDRLVLKEDKITSKPFVPGRPYHFIITASARDTSYNVTDTARLKDLSGLILLESPKKVITIIPKNPVLGTEFPSGNDHGSIVPHNKWNSAINYDDAVQVKVVDPWRTENKKYRITFRGGNPANTLDVSSWSLLELNSNNEVIDTVIANYTDFSGGGNYPTVSNVMPVVQQLPIGVRRMYQSPSGFSYKGKRWFYGVRGRAMDDSLSAMFISVTPRVIAPRTGVVTFPTTGKYTNLTSNLRPDSLRRVEIRFSKTNTQKAYRYVNGFELRPIRGPIHPEFNPYLVDSTGFGYLYQDYQKFRMGIQDSGYVVPFTVWEIDSIYGDGKPRQLDVAIVERNDSMRVLRKDIYGRDSIVYVYRGKIDARWDPSPFTTENHGDGDEIILVFRSTYSDSAKPEYTKPNVDYKGREFGNLPLMYVVGMRKLTSQSNFADGDVIAIRPNYALNTNKVFEFEVKPPKVGISEIAKQRDEMRKIKIVPNPYYASHQLQADPFDSYVTFTNLPPRAKIRVFNLAGDMVAVVNHDYQDQMDNSSTRWDLKNHANIPVASGMYIAHIEGFGFDEHGREVKIGEKVLKFAIFIQEERLDTF
ncbi:MAG: hypothetical protein QME58_00195 [Bacteroidota bacterium]|nr:hypothetical protein [Bacteroidota bacterium]